MWLTNDYSIHAYREEMERVAAQVRLVNEVRDERPSFTHRLTRLFAHLRRLPQPLDLEMQHTLEPNYDCVGLRRVR